MIEITIDGKLPKVNEDRTATMAEIGDVMFRSVQQNFIEGGRPKTWPTLSPWGEPSHLYDTGWMFENIQLDWGGQYATVFIDTDRVPYAMINNFGGVMGNGGLMSQREFMMFQEEDVAAILELYGDAIFSKTEPR
jgi:phage gpG-like protein